MKKQSDESWKIAGFYLANGKSLSKENIDISVLMNLNNVQRAFSSAGVPPSVNLTVTGHSYLSYLIAGRLCAKFPGLGRMLDDAKIGVPGFMGLVMAHDIQEALLGDIPTPLKNEAFQEFEDSVASGVMDFLSLDSDKNECVYQLIKICDLIASLYECKFATLKGYDLSLIYEKRYNSLLLLCGANDREGKEFILVGTTPIRLSMGKKLVDELIDEIVPK